MYQVPPSRGGYNLATADLDRAGIPRSTLLNFIATQQSAAQNGNSNNLLSLEALLAQMLLDMNRKNTQATNYTYQLGAWQKQMILGANPARDYFFLQNPGSGDVLIVFESGNRTPEDFSANAGTQNTLVTLQRRSVRVISGGYFEPLKAPKNEISVFTLGTGTQGMVIEGQS